MRTGYHFHFAHNHIGIIHKVAVHLDTVFIGAEMHPIGFNVDKPVTLLQKDDVRGDFRSCGILKGIVRQPYCTEQICSLCNIFSDCRIFFIHRTFRSDKNNDTSRAHLIKRSGKKVVMNKEIMLVIPLVRHFELPERDVAHRRVKEAVRQLCILKALHGNAVFLIKLLCNST